VVPEAPLEWTEHGAVPAGEGWFVLNARDARWVQSDGLGVYVPFESEAARFAELGINISLLQPGEPSCMYHAEETQEDFLVLAGECLLLVEGEERPLKAWDFVHCPAGTEHIFVGAGDGPCVVFMAGARTEPRDTVYVRSDVALRHGAGAETETDSSAEAYAPFGGRTRWRPGPPASWDGLPWELR
jgi:uncharacterized cupin superfamily protein